MKESLLRQSSSKVKSSVSRRGFLRKGAVGAGLLIGATGTAAAEGEKNDLNFNLSSGRFSSDPDDVRVIRVGWEWTYDDRDDDEADPDDGVGIYWDANRWKIYIQEYDTADKHCSWDGAEKYSEDKEGVSWKYDQQQEYDDNGEGNYRSCATKLKKRDGYNTYPVFGEYHHTWDATRANGIGLESWGFKVEWDDEGKSRKEAIAYNDVP
jgi:hypothetical protein